MDALHELTDLARSIARQSGVDYDAPRTRRQVWLNKAARVMFEAQPKGTVDHLREDDITHSAVGVCLGIAIVIGGPLLAWWLQ